MTASWGSLLTRMLNIIDALALWSTNIVEELYVRSNGQVDKPFPDTGDILAVYMVEGRIYKESPQGWYIITAQQFKKGVQANPTHFWAQCRFHSDIPPVPDASIPWRGTCDPWLMRDKLRNKALWLRLCLNEDDGCSYYNLSDWIKAKRKFYDRTTLSSVSQLRSENRMSSTPKGMERKRFRVSGTSKGSREQSVGSPGENQREGSRTKLMKTGIKKLKSPVSIRRGRTKNSEYITADNTSESSSSGSDNENNDGPDSQCSLTPNSFFGKTVFRVSTGKVSRSILTASTSAVSSANITPCKRNRSTILTEREKTFQPALSLKTTSRLLKDPRWIELRDETCTNFLNLIMARLNDSSASPLAVLLSSRIEEEAVFSKCMINEDRYVGLSRAVYGILKQFDCLIDSLETLIPLSDELRDKISGNGGNDISEPVNLFINPFSSDNI